MKRIAAVATVLAIAGGAVMFTSLPARADQNDAVAVCKALSDRGIVQNVGQCVSEANQRTNEFCQDLGFRIFGSVGACIHDIRS